MKIFKLVITLTVVCFFSGLSLSYFYSITKPEIIKNKSIREIKIKNELVKEAKVFKQIENIKNVISAEEGVDKDEKITGILIKNKVKGYAGDIEYLVSITTYSEARIVEIKILSHRETPGLGAKITERSFLEQFKGKNINELLLKKDSPLGAIDSITGATITSRAFTNSLRKTLSEDTLNNYLKSKLVQQPTTVYPVKIYEIPKKRVVSSEDSQNKEISQIKISTVTNNIQNENSQ